MTASICQILNFSFSLFAQAAEQPAPSKAQQALSFTFMIFFFLVAMYLLFVLPKRSRDKQMKKMIDTLKKNDKVMTSSGMIGTIFSIDKENNEVVLKVDDSTNTKIHFSAEAIYYIFKDKDKAENKESK